MSNPSRLLRNENGYTLQRRPDEAMYKLVTGRKQQQHIFGSPPPVAPPRSSLDRAEIERSKSCDRAQMEPRSSRHRPVRCPTLTRGRDQDGLADSRWRPDPHSRSKREPRTAQMTPDRAQPDPRSTQWTPDRALLKTAASFQLMPEPIPTHFAMTRSATNLLRCP